MDGQTGESKRGKTYYHSLSESGTAYTVVAWVVAAIILICLIVYLCNKRSILLNKILRFVLLAMTPILPIMFFVALGQAKTYDTVTDNWAGTVQGEGYRSCTNFWGVLFVIAFFALFGYLVYQCIKNPNPKFVSTNKEVSISMNVSGSDTEMKKFESDADAYSYFISQSRAIIDLISEKSDAAFEKYKPLLDKITKISYNLGDTKKFLTELHDKDFDELNEIYEKYNKYQVVNDELLNSERYLTLKENCIRKNLPNVEAYCANMEEICGLNIEAYTYKRQFEEWSDVMNLKAREKWSLPEQKELYDKLYALKNDELYLALQKKLSEWIPYSSGSLLLFDDSNRSYEIGRHGQEVALKDQKNFEIKKLSVDDIIFVKINETSTPSYSPKPNKMGIAMTEMFWGTAAATASAMQKNQREVHVAKP